MRIEDLPEPLCSDTFRILNSFTSPLLKLSGDRQKDEKPLLIGSGTFIRIGKQSGILTAQHVVDQLDGPCLLGLPITQTENQFSIPKDQVDAINIARAMNESEGPDLAFIGLGVPDIATVRSVKWFYDLDSDKARMLSDPPALDAGFWAACGTLGINTREEPSEIGLTAALALNSYCAFSVPHRQYETDTFDYIELDVSYAPGLHTPATFGGTSGGGLWQVLLNENDRGELERAGFYLSGVIFYETAVEDQRRFIRCHGRRSVYERVYETIQRNSSWR